MAKQIGKRIQRFVDRLGECPVDGSTVLNQYHIEGNFPQFFTTRMNLLLYLQSMKDLAPKTLLVGEAAGQKGCALSGVPFTSLDVMSRTNGYGLFGFDDEYEGPYQKENTSTMVWEVLEDIDLCPLLWNAYPFNPFQRPRGEATGAAKNRRPTKAEVEVGRGFLDELLTLFPSVEHFIAMGGVAADLLGRMELEHYRVPHPSYGKKTRFRNELYTLLLTERIA